eukprot:3182444-Amphidinium_carterae.1
MLVLPEGRCWYAGSIVDHILQQFLVHSAWNLGTSLFLPPALGGEPGGLDMGLGEYATYSCQHTIGKRAFSGSLGLWAFPVAIVSHKRSQPCAGPQTVAQTKTLLTSTKRDCKARLDNL